MSTWEEALVAIRIAVRQSCSQSTYGEVELDQVREVLPEEIDDRQLNEGLRHLRQRGELDAYFSGAGKISRIRWLGDF